MGFDAFNVAEEGEFRKKLFPEHLCGGDISRSIQSQRTTL